MTWTELISDVAKDSGEPRHVVARVLHSFIDVAQKTLMSEEQVRLREFGVFYTVASPKKIFGTENWHAGRSIVRFRETRCGQVQRRDQRREDEDRG